MMSRERRSQLQSTTARSRGTRRLALLVGGSVAVVLVAIALWPSSRTSIDFRISRVWPPSKETTTFRDTRWYELGPKDWDPYKEERELRRTGTRLQDADPKATALLKRLHDIRDNAPINPALDGRDIRIPGYVVPLEAGKDGVTEFLLVPYFGACIHTPPPPSNQILRITAPRAIAKLQSMDSIWVSGRLHAVRSDTSMGRSSYAMRLDVIEPYVRPPQ